MWCEACGPLHDDDLAPGEAKRILNCGFCDKCVAADASDKFWKWAIIVAALIVAIMCITLGGCTREQPRRYEINDIENMEAPGPEKHNLSNGIVEVFYLNDGTRCVVFSSSSLVCQWKEFKEVEDVGPNGLLFEGEMTRIRRPQ
jgi:hypothetical protein